MVTLIPIVMLKTRLRKLIPRLNVNGKDEGIVSTMF